VLPYVLPKGTPRPDDGGGGDGGFRAAYNRSARGAGKDRNGAGHPGPWPLNASGSQHPPETRKDMRRDVSNRAASRLAAALLAFIGVLAAGCVSPQRTIEAPVVELVGLALLESQADAQRFRVELRVTNPNEGRIDIQHLSFSVRLAGGGVMRGRVDEPLALEPGERRYVEANVPTSLVSSVSRLQALVQGQSATVPYDLDGLVTLSRGLNPIYPFNARGEVPLALPRGLR